MTQNGYILKHADESLKDDEYFISMLLNEGIKFADMNMNMSKRIIKEYDEETLRNLALHIKGAH